jgi:hypothetical protein
MQPPLAEDLLLKADGACAETAELLEQRGVLRRSVAKQRGELKSAASDFRRAARWARLRRSAASSLPSDEVLQRLISDLLNACEEYVSSLEGLDDRWAIERTRLLLKRLDRCFARLMALCAAGAPPSE